MKTKIIYISGNEIFDMADIRAAFEEVRNALNLDKTTVLFGVPVDEEDAGFAKDSIKTESIIEETTPLIDEEEPVVETEIIKTEVEKMPEIIEIKAENESVVEQPVKKRGRPRKEIHEETEPDVHMDSITDFQGKPVPEVEEIKNDNEDEEKVVPILSVLSSDEESEEPEAQTVADIPVDEIKDEETVEIIPDVSVEEIKEDISVEITTAKISDDDEADLEKLLSAMTPLEEDVVEDQQIKDIVKEPEPEPVDLSVDATLEQLATEFVENQDKIAAESKSNSRSKIGKLRSILPFKQSKHKDQGLGDLFGWAGIAANDEDFSVPGFFTSAVGKK